MVSENLISSNAAAISNNAFLSDLDKIMDGNYWSDGIAVPAGTIFNIDINDNFNFSRVGIFGYNIIPPTIYVDTENNTIKMMSMIDNNIIDFCSCPYDVFDIVQYNGKYLLVTKNGLIYVYSDSNWIQVQNILYKPRKLKICNNKLFLCCGAGDKNGRIFICSFDDATKIPTFTECTGVTDVSVANSIYGITDIDYSSEYSCYYATTHLQGNTSEYNFVLHSDTADELSSWTSELIEYECYGLSAISCIEDKILIGTIEDISDRGCYSFLYYDGISWSKEYTSPSMLVDDKLYQRIHSICNLNSTEVLFYATTDEESPIREFGDIASISKVDISSWEIDSKITDNNGGSPSYLKTANSNNFISVINRNSEFYHARIYYSVDKGETWDSDYLENVTDYDNLLLNSGYQNWEPSVNFIPESVYVEKSTDGLIYSQLDVYSSTMDQIIFDSGYGRYFNVYFNIGTQEVGTGNEASLFEIDVLSDYSKIYGEDLEIEEEISKTIDIYLTISGEIPIKSIDFSMSPKYNAKYLNSVAYSDSGGIENLLYCIKSNIFDYTETTAIIKSQELYENYESYENSWFVPNIENKHIKFKTFSITPVITPGPTPIPEDLGDYPCEVKIIPTHLNLNNCEIIEYDILSLYTPTDSLLIPIINPEIIDSGECNVHMQIDPTTITINQFIKFNPSVMAKWEYQE